MYSLTRKDLNLTFESGFVTLCSVADSCHTTQVLDPGFEDAPSSSILDFSIFKCAQHDEVVGPGSLTLDGNRLFGELRVTLWY